MIQVEWTSRAFLVLETLPQTIAFDIIRRVDFLPNFPEMGAKFDSRFPNLDPLSHCETMGLGRLHGESCNQVARATPSQR